MSQRKDIETLLQKYERQLQKLKEKLATYGLETPPHILIQIEDTEAEIESLQAKLEQLGGPGPEKSRPIAPLPSPSPPAPTTFTAKLLAIARDPVWQMIGVIIALAALGWTIFTFFVAPPEPAAERPPVTVEPGPTLTLPGTRPAAVLIDPPLAESTEKRRIGLGQTVTGTLYFNEGAEWLFSDGPAVVDILLDVGPYGDGLLMLFDPGGTQRASVDAQRGGEERLANYAIPDDGDYTIMVRNTKNEAANYTLTVRKAQKPDSIGLNQTVTGTLYFNEGNAWLFSQGPATINIILDAGPYGEALLMLFDPGGTQREYVDAQTGREERLMNYTIPDDGDYTILVRNTKNEPADYTLTVEAASN